MKELKIAVCQLKVVNEKDKNLIKAERMIKISSKNKADIIVLPEMFNTPYDNESFLKNAENYPGPTTELLSKLASQNQVYIIGGSIPEKDTEHSINNNICNCSNRNSSSSSNFNSSISNNSIYNGSNFISSNSSNSSISSSNANIGNINSHNKSHNNNNNNNKIYNTSFVFNRNGKIIAKHRKLHLFDVNIQDGINFKESDIIKSGNTITVFDTEFCKIGLCICYDIRFPEIFIKMVKEGAKIIIIPAAFNLTTGPAHWSILTKARAIDNQVFIVGASPAKNTNLKYISYGHSVIVNPWGKVIASAGYSEKIIFGKINIDVVDQIRRQLPVLLHKRVDLY